jgi:hypothetical protein
LSKTTDNNIKGFLLLQQGVKLGGGRYAVYAGKRSR